MTLTKQIVVNDRIEGKSGVTNNKAWTIWTIIAEDGWKATTFNPELYPIGAAIEVNYEVEKKPKTQGDGFWENNRLIDQSINRAPQNATPAPKSQVPEILAALARREEAIQSSLLEKIPGLNRLVLASSRAFTGFLNYTRFSRFTDLLAAARLNGEDVSKGSSVVRDIAKTVNDFTGRGALGKGDRYGNITPAANAFFFSPRKISATIEMFDPVRYLDPKISPTARLGAIRQLTGSLLATSAIISLARISGATVELNPTSSDFGKIRIGGTTIDITGGNATYLRLLARLITGNIKSATTGVTKKLGSTFGAATRGDELVGYIRGKLSPLASAFADWLYGKDQGGTPFSLKSEAESKLVPIIIQDFINFIRNDPHNAAAIVPALSGIFGAGIESQAPPPPKKPKR